jgi:hypothetical protein
MGLLFTSLNSRSVGMVLSMTKCQEGDVHLSRGWVPFRRIAAREKEGNR